MIKVPNARRSLSANDAAASDVAPGRRKMTRQALSSLLLQSTWQDEVWIGLTANRAREDGGSTVVVVDPSAGKPDHPDPRQRAVGLGRRPEPLRGRVRKRLAVDRGIVATVFDDALELVDARQAPATFERANPLSGIRPGQAIGTPQARCAIPALTQRATLATPGRWPGGAQRCRLQ